MNKTLSSILAVAALAAGARAASLPGDDYVVDTRRSPHAALRPLPYHSVQWTTGFWADRYKQLAEVTLGESWRLLADPDAGHVLENFRLAAGQASGAYAGTNWQDEWLYKWIEAAACVWRTTRDPMLEQRMDEGITLIAAAQQPDGYVSTNILVPKRTRFTRPQDHEIYNMGHLLTAGVIHRRMTGKDSLFTVARKVGDFLCANLGVTVDPHFAHNPSAIMGLTELYRETGEKKYLDCAAVIVDRRGEKPKTLATARTTPGLQGTDQIQDRVPVRSSSEIVGHNVFFTYLYTGAGDLVAENGDATLDAALGRLWADLTERKMFINGGISAVPQGLSHGAQVAEAAGRPYELPNAGCYNEACGQVGALMWGYRMLANHPDAQVADVMEREMFNGFLGDIGLDGTSWFYRNVLRRYDADYKPDGLGAGPLTDMVAREKPGRMQICCPSNLLRTMAELNAYFYSLDDAGLWVHHYGGSKVACTLVSGEPFALEQATDYPWSGDVKIIVQRAPAKSVALRLRAPGWAGGEVALAVNGQSLGAPKLAHGYATVARTWRAGDTLTISFPLRAQLVVADPRVEEARNQVAVVRGPVLYCVESPDLPRGVDVPSVFVPSDATFAPEFGLAGSDAPLARKTAVLRGTGLRRAEPSGAPLYRPVRAEPLQPFELKLVPYFAWANRGRSAMSVWLPVVWKTAGTN